MFFVVSMLWQDHFLSFFFPFFLFHFLPLLFRANRNLNFQIVNTASAALSQELGWRVSFRTRCGKISWLTQLQMWEWISKKENKIWILTWKRLDAGVLRRGESSPEKDCRLTFWQAERKSSLVFLVCLWLPLKIVYYRLQHQTKLCSSTCVNANCKVKRICSQNRQRRKQGTEKNHLRLSTYCQALLSIFFARCLAAWRWLKKFYFVHRRAEEKQHCFS